MRLSKKSKQILADMPQGGAEKPTLTPRDGNRAIAPASQESPTEGRGTLAQVHSTPDVKTLDSVAAKAADGTFDSPSGSGDPIRSGPA